VRIACLIVGLVFLISAALQWNDPDPWGWIAIWTAGAAVSLWAVLRPVPRGAAWLVAAVALAWAIIIAPAALADFRFADLARTMQAESPAIELSRELLGLVVIAGWSIAVALVRGAKKQTAREHPGRS
jgi:hypothetical protein